MPELPEVTTTVYGLNKKVVHHKIKAVWTDLAKKSQPVPHFQDTIKNLSFFNIVKKELVGARITKSERKGKNILIHLSTGDVLLIHLKMTGHLLYGSYTYDKKTNSWKPSDDEKNNALRDPFNRFIHFVITFDNNKQLALSDTRKFAKVTLIKKTDLHSSKHLIGIGSEPLEKDYTVSKFIADLYKKPNGKIKQVLMDATVVAGIGNIYSDEMLCDSGIHPLSKVSSIPKQKLKELFTKMQKVLTKGIDFGGDSMSDYRTIDGERGNFQNEHTVYKRNKKPCLKNGCGGTISRIIVGGRSAHFCNTHQKLWMN